MNKNSLIELKARMLCEGVRVDEDNERILENGLIKKVVMIGGGVLASLIGYLYYKYKMKEKPVTWDNDQNWEVFFKGLYKENNIAKHMIDILLDSYAL